MTPRAALLAIVCTLSGFRTAVAESCPPRARVSGDAPTVERVATELRKLGVATPAATEVSRCPTLEAMVTASDAGIAVAIKDRTRRSEGRVVSDATLAAAWIDSWLHDDNELPMPDAAPALDVIAPSDARTVAVVPPPATPARALGDRFTIGVGYERSYRGDVAAWDGGGAMGCVHLGAVCLGVRARLASISQPADLAVEPSPTGAPPTSGRRDLSAFTVASYSIKLGQTILSPEIGLGIGRLSSTTPAGCKLVDSPEPPPSPGCDPSDPAGCAPEPEQPLVCAEPATSTSTTTVTWTPRAALALRIAIPLFDQVWLDGLASIAFAPLGATAREMSVDANGTYVPAVAGDPLTAIQLGVGLRVGLP